MKNPEGWARLEARAQWTLEHPDQISPLDTLQGRALVLRLWRHRRSGPRVSWGLFVPEGDDNRALVREATWNEAADLRRMSSRRVALKRRPAEEPSVRVRDAVVGRATLVPFLRHAAEVLPVGAVRDGEPGPAGAEFGIEGFRALSCIRFVWTGKGPDDYRNAAAWTDRLRALLEASLRERETA